MIDDSDIPPSFAGAAAMHLSLGGLGLYAPTRWFGSSGDRLPGRRPMEKTCFLSRWQQSNITGTYFNCFHNGSITAATADAAAVAAPNLCSAVECLLLMPETAKGLKLLEFFLQWLRAGGR